LTAWLMIERFTEWARQYGGLYTLKLGPGTVAVLTDRRIIKQLMDKRSAVSSDRPLNLVGQQLITEGDHVLLMSNSPTWRMMRKLIHQSLTESLCNNKHTKIQQAEATQMLHDMMQEPNQWPEHFKRFSNSVIMSIGKLKTSCKLIFSAFRPISLFPPTEAPWHYLYRGSRLFSLRHPLEVCRSASYCQA
jgi:cytochrome P450